MEVTEARVSRLPVRYPQYRRDKGRIPRCASLLLCQIPSNTAWQGEQKVSSDSNSIKKEHYFLRMCLGVFLEGARGTTAVPNKRGGQCKPATLGGRSQSCDLTSKSTVQFK